MIIQSQLTIETPGRKLIDITSDIQSIIDKTQIDCALCNIFIHHTSASLLITENYDPEVKHDLENFMYRLVVDGDENFKHQDEGPDDMPSHIRSILTETSLNIPIIAKRLALGRWQGIYLWEHRLQRNDRAITVTLVY